MWLNNNNFLITASEIPGLPPQLSEESRLWWKEQKRRCTEGYWSCGKWMPPSLYFYANFWHILLNKDEFSQVKVKGRPLIWDIFWEMSLAYTEARGFTGFEKTPKILSYRDLAMEKGIIHTDVRELYKELPDRRLTLTETTEDLGKALYLHEAENLMIMGNRGCGKSYFVAGGIIAREWLFDGLYEYIPDDEITQKVEVLVGAGDAIYSTALLNKVSYGLQHLPGAQSMYGTYYPSPFAKQYKGSFAPNTETIAEYSEKVGGNWLVSGTGSCIFHKSFRDNQFAGQGRRNSVIVLEEVGMMDNLLESSGPLEDNMKIGERKFGTLVMLGTGGDMEGGTIGASRMFYDTKGYKLVAFDDVYEHKGKIGYFIPTTKGTAQYKDKDGNTDLALAEKEDDIIREEIRKSTNASTLLDARKQNQPRVPSEMFLSKTGNIFPRAELQEHLGRIESSSKHMDAEDVGELIYDEAGILKWHHISKDRAIKVFPHDFHRDDCRGAISIWHHPLKDDSGQIPTGLYIAGTDPYDHDESGTPSLGSTFIYMKMFPGPIKETIVAEYSGRHEKGSDGYYEQVRRLLEYYNASDMFENNLIGMYKYFERKNSSHRLMDTPEYAKETGTQPNRPKGMHFGPAQIVHGELLIKNMLEEEIAPGILQLTKIKSVPLLKELIAYNRKGNFDRVRALMCVMYAREETFRNTFEEQKKVTRLAADPFFDRNYKGKQESIWDKVKFGNTQSKGIPLKDNFSGIS